LKEEQFLRYLLATAVLAFSLAGTHALALASTTPAAPAAAPAASAQVDGPGTTVDSPDVAEWTAQTIHDQQTAAAAHHGSALHLFAAHGLSKFASRILSRTTTIARNLTHAALRFLGTPYVFGGTSTTGFDCSGYTQHVFAMLGLSIPRTADAQYYAGNRIRGTMKPGDLVFFQTYEPGPSHVGIYLGNGQFVHASSSHGVMVSHLSDSYWSERYIGAKRFIAQR
jgi:cell wall-associated NlpC family hydrolase